MNKVTAVLSTLLALALTGCASTGDAAEQPARGAFLAPAELEYLGVIDTTVDRSTDELVDAAHAACDQIMNGRDSFQVHVFDDDTRENGFWEDSVRVALAAAPRLCPDLD